MGQKKSKKVVRIVLISVITFLVLILGGFYLYTRDYYHADEKAQTISDNLSVGEVQITKKGCLTIIQPVRQPLLNLQFIYLFII